MTEPAHKRLAEALKDRYTLERELGEGGMATVYLAEDLKHHECRQCHRGAVATVVGRLVPRRRHVAELLQ